ncbi:MAG: hypothetical protein AABW67_02365 [Nanoarchaeota archaeon]
MFKKITESKKIIKNVLVRRNYFILFASTSILLFLVLYLLTLATTTDHRLSIFIMMNGLGYAISTFFLLFVISLLFGIYVCLFAYKIRKNLRGKKIISIFGGSGGFIVGIFGAGCPMCGSVIFALFGAPLALFFMPFKGLELRVLSILILSVSVYLISRNIHSCKIKIKK